MTEDLYKKIKNEEMSAIYLTLFEQASKGETIRIVCGELKAIIYNPIADKIIEHVYDKKLNVKILSGPVFNTIEGKNILLDRVFEDKELARNFKFYVSVTRQKHHYALVGNSVACIQKPHSVASNFKYVLILNEKTAIVEKMQIQNYERSFERYLEAFKSKVIQDVIAYSENFLSCDYFKFDDDIIEQITNKAFAQNLDYDFLQAKDIIQLVSTLN